MSSVINPGLPSGINAQIEGFLGAYLSYLFFIADYFLHLISREGFQSENRELEMESAGSLKAYSIMFFSNVTDGCCGQILTWRHVRSCANNLICGQGGTNH